VPQGIRANTIAVLQSLRSGDVPYAAATRRLEEVIKEDPVIGHELQEVERKALIDALLDQNNSEQRVTELIHDALSGARRHAPEDAS